MANCAIKCVAVSCSHSTGRDISSCRPARCALATMPSNIDEFAGAPRTARAHHLHLTESGVADARP